MKVLSSLIILVLAGMLTANFISAEEKIDINTAPLEDLIKIIHIGEVRAQELISLRPFSSLDDLVRINGISENRVKDIKEQGLAWISGQEEIEEVMELSSQSAEPIIAYPANIVINEILPSPTGSDSEEEWIEILNQNNFAIGLFNWQITDTVGKTTVYIFPQDTTLSAKQFLVLKRPASKITLNNSGDSLKLIQPDGQVIDEVMYEKAPQGESFNRVNNHWVWSNTLTPDAPNSVPVAKTQEENQIAKPLEPDKKALAAVSEQITQSGSSSSVVLPTALILAVFSATIILILKKKIKTG